jgi:hypothetical protein
VSLIFVFIDGIGLGNNSTDNPFCEADRYPAFTKLAGGTAMTRDARPYYHKKEIFLHIDACLGVEGLPQSGTGQATLLSGINASKVLGRHFGPYPHSKIRYLLEEHSLFKQISHIGRSFYFMNAFPKIFFERAEARNRWSCCTLMTRSAGQQLNSVAEIKQGRAITAGLRQDYWRANLNLDVPEISEEEAARRTLKMAEEKDLVFAEYYLTDKAGHNQDPEYASEMLGRIDHFLMTILEEKTDSMTLLVTSDHGNLEDLSTKTHTLNKVPLFVNGPMVSYFSGVKSIIDITPAIAEAFGS